ncbi:hypothetical protein HU762_17815 [Pseudomonas sp. SWRI92]|uniref:hypothetical protein n=1 Tax=Pseudomonas sp. SWRI92 TaxID=2745499 RepID=UPI001646E1C8|nr:hypothetical protein [Pseudomonas sp. SWRI92]MBC3375811.1 hypothetical protein [Pseudomonas sp. SWRI92]
MPQLKVWKDSGELLFDTSLISYGLVKSGNMVFQTYWTRKTLRSAQLDPNDGANWTTSVATTNPQADPLHGFTVSNAVSPIVFIVGSGCLQGTARTGSTLTFYYANASTSTKFYCFDLMQDNIAGSPYLKTYTDAGVITFNSLQPPLNVVAAIQAPVPGPLDSRNRYTTVYVGGSNSVRSSASASSVARVDSKVDIAIGSGVEYAAYLPWSRSCAVWDYLANENIDLTFLYTGAEGAYGRVGGISFLMGAAAATTQQEPLPTSMDRGARYSNLPTDRYPVALVIQTSNLPFPYN